jgi:hypothetical protein
LAFFRKIRPSFIPGTSIKRKDKEAIRIVENTVMKDKIKKQIPGDIIESNIIGTFLDIIRIGIKCHT